MGDFEKMLPDEIVIPSLHSGEELVLTYNRAQQAVEMATERLIAVLGVELFRILDDGLGVETYSGYSLESGPWRDFVAQNNREAALFLAGNTRGEGYGYILTATSEHEFRDLHNPVDESGNCGDSRGN